MDIGSQGSVLEMPVFIGSQTDHFAVIGGIVPAQTSEF